MKHWRLMIPLVALALAMLAYDSYYITPAGVIGVYAEPDQRGVAYAYVRSETASGEGLVEEPTFTVYRTNDYGATWHRSNSEFPESTPPSLPLRISYLSLWLNQEQLWTFPERRVFRNIFVDTMINDPYTAERPYWHTANPPSNSLAGDVLYVAMGSEGVLVLPAPGSAASFEPRLSAEGITPLNPLILSINDPFKILSVILLALLVPPLPLTHAYLLSRVWRYISPTQAFRWALVISGGLSVCAGVGIAAWMTNIQIEFEPMVAVMTLLCVAFGVIGALLLPDKRKFRFRLLLVLASALVSLIVPFAVSTLWWGWYPVIAGLCGYYLLRRSIIASLSVNDLHAEWTLDRGAIELIAIMLVASYTIPFVPVIFLFAGFGAIIIWRWYAWSQRISDKPRSAWRPLAFLGVWIVISLVASGGLYFVQMYALSWFNSLIK
jgi:hypothetical protein